MPACSGELLLADLGEAPTIEQSGQGVEEGQPLELGGTRLGGAGPLEQVPLLGLQCLRTQA